MNINENTNDKDDRFDFEVRRALLEDAHCPDARRAFRHFKQRIGISESRMLSFRPYYIIASVAACVAVLICLVISIGDGRNGASMDERQRQLAKIGNVVYLADDSRNVISLSMNGKTIDLSARSSGMNADVVLVSDHLVRMFDMADDDANEMTISVPHGQTASIVLDDSTCVMLNAGSRLVFPCRFAKEGTRKVHLEGEGYFEVKHDESRPFVVNGRQLAVTVLGTVFDVRCFDQEQASVTLLEGKVSVNVDKQQMILAPGEMATVGMSGFVRVESADFDQVLGWKNGMFYFDGQSLREIMMEIGRWYNLDVVFASNRHIDERLHFSIERHIPVEEVVHQLQLISTASIVMKHGKDMIVVR